MEDSPVSNILIIDDDPVVCETVTSVLQRLHYNVSAFTELLPGVEAARSGLYDVVLLDVRFPSEDDPASEDWLSAISRIREIELAPEIIVMTGYTDPKGAELAIEYGAWDYLEKPISSKTIVDVVGRALSYQSRKRERHQRQKLDRDRIIGTSTVLLDVLELVAQAAESEIATLITGESGTGKELIAWTIHRNSARAKGNFVVVDCTALPETLIESILFGSERGAYTGADRSRDGLIAQADRGTLFMDEVGDMPPSIQKKFLRVLQERTFRPLGSNKEKSVDFRLLAATNQNLEEMVKEGRFREDLLYRIQAMRIVVPPLRDRHEDIKLLADRYLEELSHRYDRKIQSVSSDFYDVLQQYCWPGNVRELHQALEKAFAAGGEEAELFAKDLPKEIRMQVVRESVTPDNPNRVRLPPLPILFDDGTNTPPQSLKEFRDMVMCRAEKAYLTNLLAQVDYDISAACEISELSRSRLYSLLKKYNISPRPGG